MNWWEAAKNYIRAISISHTDRLHKADIQYKLDLTKKLQREQSKTQPCNTTILSIKKELEDYEITENKKIFAKTKTEFLEEDEKPTAYFFNLERERKAANTINELTDKNDVTVKGTERVLSIAHEYFQSLYTEQKTDNEDQDWLISHIKRTLPIEQRSHLDEDFTTQEFFTALATNETQ